MKFYLQSSTGFRSRMKAIHYGETVATPHVIRGNVSYWISPRMQFACQSHFELLPNEIVYNDPRPEFARLTAEWQDMAANDFRVAQQCLQEGDTLQDAYWQAAYEFSSSIARQRLFQLIGNGEDA